MKKICTYISAVAFFAATLFGCRPVHVDTNSFDAEADIVDINGNPIKFIRATETKEAVCSLRIYCSHAFYIDDIKSSFDFKNYERQVQDPGNTGYVTITSEPRKITEMDKETVQVTIRDAVTDQRIEKKLSYIIYPYFFVEVTQPLVYVQDGEDVEIELHSSVEKLIVKNCTFIFNKDIERDGQTYKNYLFKPNSVLTLERDLTRDDDTYYKKYVFHNVKVDEMSDQIFSITCLNFEKEDERTDYSFNFRVNTKFWVNVEFTDTIIRPVESYEDKSREMGNIKMNISSNRNKINIKFTAHVTGGDGQSWIYDTLQIASTPINQNSYTTIQLPTSPANKVFMGTFTGVMQGFFENDVDIEFTAEFTDPEDERSHDPDKDPVSSYSKQTLHVIKTDRPESLDISYRQSREDGYTKNYPSYIDFYDNYDLDPTATAFFKFEFNEGSNSGGCRITQISNKSEDPALEGGTVALLIDGEEIPASLFSTEKAYDYIRDNDEENISGEFEIRGVKPGPVTLRFEPVKYPKDSEHPGPYKEISFTVRERVALVVNMHCSAEQATNSYTISVYGFSKRARFGCWNGSPRDMSMAFCTYTNNIKSVSGKFRPNFEFVFGKSVKGQKPPKVKSEIKISSDPTTCDYFYLDGENASYMWWENDKSGISRSAKSQSFETVFSENASQDIPINEETQPLKWFRMYNPCVTRVHSDDMWQNSSPYKSFSYDITDVEYDSKNLNLKYIIYAYECYYDSGHQSYAKSYFGQSPDHSGLSNSNWTTRGPFAHEPWWLDGKLNDKPYGCMDCMNLQKTRPSIVEWKK